MLSIEAWMRTTKYKEGPDGDFMILGHSIGGYLATHFILDYPERITKLILLSVNGI